jgi:hypothetical protein
LEKNHQKSPIFIDVNWNFTNFRRQELDNGVELYPSFLFGSCRIWRTAKTSVSRKLSTSSLQDDANSTTSSLRFQRKVSTFSRFKLIFALFFALGSSLPLNLGVNPTKLFSLLNEDYFPFFAILLGHFNVQTIFSCSTNTQA